MAARTKRTYNLPTATVRRVRELAERYGAAATQDGVVELAVEKLYLEARDLADAGSWAAAATDPAFRTEVDAIAADLDEPPESWPR
jgi:hypothetical protein